MRVGLMVPEFEPHADAVGIDVASMYAALRDAGHESAILTRLARSPADYEIRGYDAASLYGGDDLLIYHFASSDDGGLQALAASAARTVIRYHNVTPAHFFHDVAPEISADLEHARRSLALFTALPGCHGLAASRFNERDLLASGLPAARSSVLPPMHQADRLTGEAPAKGAAGNSGLRLLAVGRIAPNKQIDLLLDCFADALAQSPVKLHLTIVGSRDPRLQHLNSLIDSRVAERGIAGQIEFVERATTAELAGHYCQADAYITCSAHEGFCVPAVEAMAFAKPVIASDTAALPETCGDAAILCGGRRDFVSAILELSRDAELRRRLGAQGRQCYERCFRSDLLVSQFLSIIRRIAADRPERRTTFWQRLKALAGQ